MYICTNETVYADTHINQNKISGCYVVDIINFLAKSKKDDSAWLYATDDIQECYEWSKTWLKEKISLSRIPIKDIAYRFTIQDTEDDSTQIFSLSRQDIDNEF